MIQIDGSLSYIQPIDINNISYVVGVGYETNYSTWQSFMIFLVDISNSSSPEMTATYKDSFESYTESINDFLSFRYLSESKKLVMPFSKTEYINNDTSLAGFIVYDIFRNSIVPKFKVTHSKSPSPCYFDAKVPPRSFIHQSQLTTIMGHTAIRTDMQSGRFISELDLDIGFNYSGC
jgi:DNA excision repair protein ERCC-4